MAKAVAKAKTRAAAAATAEVSEGQGPSGGRPKWNPPNFPFDAVKKQGGHSYLSESLRGHERESYMAAGVLFYSFLADGRLVLLLATRERGDCATESTRGREADQWCFLGGKREGGIDQSPEETALREAYEETAGRLRVKPQLSLVAWHPDPQYALFLSHLPGHMDLPLVFALWKAQGNTSWGGTQTKQLQWVPLSDILHDLRRCRSSFRTSRMTRKAFMWCKSLLPWLRHQQKHRQQLLQGYTGRELLSRKAARQNKYCAGGKRLRGPRGRAPLSRSHLHPTIQTATVRPWLLEPQDDEGRRLSCTPAGLSLQAIPTSLMCKRPPVRGEDSSEEGHRDETEREY